MYLLFWKRLFGLPRFIRKIFYQRWNRFIFLCNKVEFGCNMKVYNCFHLAKHPLAKIVIGDNFLFTSGEAFNPLSRNIRGCIYAGEGASIQIGNNVGISSSSIRAKESITIGNNVLIGGDCIIIDTDSHSLDSKVRNSGEVNCKGMSLDSLAAKSRPIVIENDVLIGARCIVLKGVTIGARSVIGSGSVVAKSIPPDCIAAGNPCKVIRNNVSDELI